MAVVQVTQAPSREMYEHVARIVNLDGARPEGLVLHIATDLPTGEVQIIDVYETAEQLAAVGEHRVIPAFAQAGVLDQVLAGPRPVATEAFAIIR